MEVRMTDGRNELNKMLRQQRVMMSLTLAELAERSGVSSSHLGRIERGERFPSGRTLRKLAKPLGFEETELFTLANYLSPQISTVADSLNGGRLDPYVAKVLSEESLEMQRTVVTVLNILKSMAKR